MPRRPLRCCVDLTIEKLSAPGVWLSSREDVYLSVKLFNEYRTTCLVPPSLPLLFHEKFRFEKVFYSALDPSEVIDFLQDHIIVFELIQLSDYTDGGVRLASYTADVRDFLYPYPGYSTSFSTSCRDALMTRTVAFPGISPKLEFSTKTYITESFSPEVDAFEDALDEERELIRRRKGVVTRRSRSRTRSPSPGLTRRFSATTLDDDYDIDSNIRPPFVVRHLDNNLIGRLPGGPVVRGARSRSRSRSRTRLPGTKVRSRSLSAGRTPRSYSFSDLDTYKSPRYHVTKVSDYTPVYKRRYYSDDDAEVADLTSSVYVPSYSSRAKSPLLSRPSLTSRYLDTTYTPTSLSTASRISNNLSINRSLERLDRSLERLDTLDRLERLDRLTSSYRTRSPYRYTSALDDLDLDIALAKHRSHVPLDNGQYWTQKSTKYRGMSHRQLFNDSMSKIYNKLYKDAKKY